MMDKNTSSDASGPSFKKRIGRSSPAFFHPLWPVFYEDNHLLVVYKPAGLIMQRDHRGKANLIDLAKQWIKTRYQKPGRVFIGMVHRLDAPVAGVLALARTSKAAARLSAQLREGRMEKRYLAVVHGQPPQTEARLIHHLARRGRCSRPQQRPSADTREARLTYRLLETRGSTSLISVRLETGRRHQIRAQLADIGCPIMGDVVYGAPEPLGNGRIALLARRLTLIHPTRQALMQFESPMPREWPWPSNAPAEKKPLWTIEEFLGDGLNLPSVSRG